MTFNVRYLEDFPRKGEAKWFVEGPEGTTGFADRAEAMTYAHLEAMSWGGTVIGRNKDDRVLKVVDYADRDNPDTVVERREGEPPVEWQRMYEFKRDESARLRKALEYVEAGLSTFADAPVADCLARVRAALGDDDA